MAPTTSRSPFAAPGEQGRGLWRALAEVTGGGLLMLLTQQAVWDLGGLPGEVQFCLGVVVLGLLAVRRRLPVTSLLGVSVLLGVLPAAGLPAAAIAYSAAKGLVAPRRRAAMLTLATVLAMLVGGLLAPAVGSGGHAFGAALGTVLAATGLIVPGLVGTSRGQQERLLLALRERAEAAEAARRLADSESRTQERSRIAAEMHDLVGHRLSLISLHTGGLEMVLQNESPELREEAALLRRASGEAMRELREVLGVLGPLGQDTGTGALTDTTGTRADIEALAEESRSGGIPLDLSWEGPDLDERPALVRRAVHRVVRESLTNVHRYATGAHVTVAITHTDERVDVSVRNGRPPQAPEAATGLGSGRGLVGLRERVALLGGTLDTGPTPAGGFEVAAHVPARPGAGVSLGATEAAADASPSEPPPDRPAARVQRRATSALTGLLGLSGVGVMMMLGLLLVSEARPTAAPSEPLKPRIGMSREKMEDQFYDDDVRVRAAATDWEPARPKSVTSCIYPIVGSEEFAPARKGKRTESATTDPTDRTEGPGRLRVTRYCFSGGKLATIDRFTVPVVSQTPPWESP